MFSLLCAWTNGWANNRDAGDMRAKHHRAHYDVTVMNTLWVLDSGPLLIWHKICLLIKITRSLWELTGAWQQILQLKTLFRSFLTSQVLTSRRITAQWMTTSFHVHSSRSHCTEGQYQSGRHISRNRPIKYLQYIIYMYRYAIFRYCDQSIDKHYGK